MKHPLEAFTAAITALAPRAPHHKIEKIWNQLIGSETYQLYGNDLEYVLHFLLISVRESKITTSTKHYMVIGLIIFFRKSNDWQTKATAQQYAREALTDLGIPEGDCTCIVKFIDAASIQSRNTPAKVISEAQKVFCDCTLVWLTAPHVKRNEIDPDLKQWLCQTKKPFFQTTFDNQFGQLTPS